MDEFGYLTRHGGTFPRQLLKKISRRGFGATILGGLASMAASRLVAGSFQAEPGADFTIAIIPDPQYLAESCPDNLGSFYVRLMSWIADNQNIVLTSSSPAFNANIKAVVGVGDCVNSTSGANENSNAEAAWTILDRAGIAFTTPPGNHDYAGPPTSRSNLGDQFSTGYFSATNRASVYGSGIDLGSGDAAYWVGSYDTTGANTAVRFFISGVNMLVLAMDFFAGNAAWSWAYEIMSAHPDCECYITTHAWLTRYGTQYKRDDSYGPDVYSMAASPYSNCAQEAWSQIGVSAWPNLCGIFSGHDISGGIGSSAAGGLPDWYWQYAPAVSKSLGGQTVHQLYVNSQQLDAACSASVSRISGAGQIGSVFLLSRRPALGLLEGRMISTYSGDWFGTAPESCGGENWSTAETLLFSVPFNHRFTIRRPDPKPSLEWSLR